MELAEGPSNNGVFVPINTAKLIDDMLAVHGHEVLIDGVFNADPHPGNVLFIEGDKPGAPHKLGLIDYGQVKHIDLGTRLQLARMMVLCDVALQLDPRTTGPGGDAAAHIRAKRAVVDEMVSFGTKTEKMDPEVIYKMGMLYYSRDDRLFTYPHNFQQYTDMLQAQDPMGSMDEIEEFIFIVRCGLMLRGLGHALHQHRALCSVWRPIAERVLQENGELDRVQKEVDTIIHG
jgi:aarF domain-containing kinase